MRNFITVLTALFIFASCVSFRPQLEPEAPKVPSFPALKWEAHVTPALFGALKQLDIASTTPKDMAAFCPAYGGLSADNKTLVHTLVLHEMAKFESGYKADKVYYECSKSRGTYSSERYVEGRGYCMVGGHNLDGGLVISRGLLQMSFSSANNYGCAFKVPTDLHDAVRNVECAAKIYGKWVREDGCLSCVKNKGAGRYWSVMREQLPNAAKIKAAMKLHGVCK